MTLSISHKLVAAFVGLTLLVLTATLGLARWSFEQGFLDYVNALEQQRLERVRQGDLHVTLKLRRNDNLQDLEQPFNEMVSTLRDRALDEASQLDKLAAKAVGMGAAGQAIARDLQGLADFRRQVGS